MGTNIHALAHRLTALSMACLASAAFVFCILSGFGCSFVRITALEGRSIGNAHGEEFEGLDVAHLGVQCLSGSDALFYPPSDDNGGDNGDGDADDNGGTGSMNTSTYTNTYTYSEGGDRLWRLSKLFLCIGLSLGGATTAFAWLLTSCVRPTAARWRILSVLAACAAVFQIPIFLVFESDNCNFDVFRQSCALSTSAYLNVVSVSIWIVTTIWVQCLRAPRWDEELDAWRVDGTGTGTGTRTGSSSSSHYGRDKGHGHGQGHGHPGEIYCDGNGNGNGNRNGNSNGNGNGNSNSNSNSNENDTVETTKNDGDLENQQRVPHAYGNVNVNGNGNELRGAFPEHALQQQQHSWRGNTNTNMGHRTSAPTNAMKRNLKQGSRSRNVGARIEPEPTTAATAGKPSFLKSLIKNNIPKLQISRSPKRQSQSSPPLRAVTEGVHHPYRHHPRHHHHHQHQHQHQHQQQHQQQQQQRPEQLPSPNRATDAVASKRTSLDTTGAVDASTSMGNTNSTRNHTVDRSRSHDKTQKVATGGTSNTGTGMGTSIGTGTGTGTDTSKNKNKKRATTPGFHISCVYRDGSHREAHFPSVATCCLGMGVPLEEDEKEDTRFKSFPHVSDDFRMVGYDEGDDDNDGNGNDGYDDYDDYDYDDYDDRNHSGNSDFLVRKLKREEEAAAGRRSGRSSKTEKAPVASLKFVTSTSTGIDRRNKSKNNNNNKNNTNNNYGSEYENDGIIGADDDAANIHYDDVSEMTRGSGWASGVSEILDDTDLRHQPRAILDELRNMY